MSRRRGAPGGPPGDNVPEPLTLFGEDDVEPNPLQHPGGKPLAGLPASGLPADPAPGADGVLRPAGSGNPGKNHPPGTGPDRPERTGRADRVPGAARPDEHSAARGGTAGPGRDAPRPAGGTGGQLTRFRPAGQDDLAPAAPAARLAANLAALTTLRAIQDEDRPATAAEQKILAGWSGFGAIPGVFYEDRAEYAAARGQLAALTTPEEYAALRRTTLNAHYPHAGYVQASWDPLARLGFDGGRVLEPGCGSGNFIGLAPDGADLTGVELDPVTAGIAAALYPDAQIRAESFAGTRVPSEWFVAVGGWVVLVGVVVAGS